MNKKFYNIFLNILKKISEEEEELDKFGEEEFSEDWKFAFEKLAQQISDQVEVLVCQKVL